MVDQVIKIAVVGVGKIVRDQHLPTIAALPDYELVAAASRNATVEGIENFQDIDALLDARADIQAVALCMPPQHRFVAAQRALSAGVHVLLEKPPGATVSEVQQLQYLANDKGVSLFASWHSRHATGVALAKRWLADATIEAVQMRWHESVRKWHPGQEWIWQAGGLGVFDPGINGLSIATHILPSALRLCSAELAFPANKQAPIAAQLSMRCGTADVAVSMDWATEGAEQWEICCQTDKGQLKLAEGGAILQIDGNDMTPDGACEYVGLYNHFSGLISNSQSDVDLSPLQLTADAFLLGSRQTVDAFYD
ncbi:MAG: Gfo/Idh/MocA family oxidoreductase [Gammaproteobacteria bacterium]|nr:Gfo/Idh/MocA family oxidoreductase [Gammaproteobacteria bacterium]